LGGEFFHTCPKRPWSPPSLLYNRYWVFPGGKERPGREANPSPLSSAVGYERVELYLYSPYGPYGLYRTSVPVHGVHFIQLKRKYIYTGFTKIYVLRMYAMWGWKYWLDIL